jgi:hypothetical protein
MLKLIKGQTSTIICTLTEKQTILDANYLFVFKNRSTNDVVSFVLVNGADISTNRERWNEFEVVVNNYFENENEGWYSYDVYEQESTTNTNTTGLNKIESGLMFLDDNTSVNYTQYSQNVNFKMYDAS